MALPIKAILLQRSRYLRRSLQLFHDSAFRAGAAFISGSLVLHTNASHVVGWGPPIAAVVQCDTVPTPTGTVSTLTRKPTVIMESALNYGRICRRLWMLFWNFLPVALLSPILWFYPLSSSTTDPNGLPMDSHQLVLQEPDLKNIPKPLFWYLKQCLRAVESSGAVIIKLTQWASSRPDLFGQSFCQILSQLQDNTTPHSMKHTELVLAEAYGEDWANRLQLHEILGSGCIGQVYRGKYIKKHPDSSKEQEQDVAVKILHPKIEDNIHADLDILRVMARYLEKRPSLQWLNIPGIVEEFAKLLLSQMDFRIEASNLERFRANFKDYKGVEFPEVVDAHEKILIETYCEGVPVVEYCRKNRDQQEHLTQLCTVAIQCVCKMIFLDNFVHGDMHPVRTKLRSVLADFLDECIDINTGKCLYQQGWVKVHSPGLWYRQIVL
jgi:predicted unusual protein kinase regulating ubiquinone biosynthesis (AarF/ABC1/UbiB family)